LQRLEEYKIDSSLLHPDLRIQFSVSNPKKAKHLQRALMNANITGDLAYNIALDTLALEAWVTEYDAEKYDGINKVAINGKDDLIAEFHFDEMSHVIKFQLGVDIVTQGC